MHLRILYYFSDNIVFLIKQISIIGYSYNSTHGLERCRTSQKRKRTSNSIHVRRHCLCLNNVVRKQIHQFLNIFFHFIQCAFHIESLKQLASLCRHLYFSTTNANSKSALPDSRKLISPKFLKFPLNECFFPKNPYAAL